MRQEQTSSKVIRNGGGDTSNFVHWRGSVRFYFGAGMGSISLFLFLADNGEDVESSHEPNALALRHFRHGQIGSSIAIEVAGYGKGW